MEMRIDKVEQFLSQEEEIDKVEQFLSQLRKD